LFVNNSPINHSVFFLPTTGKKIEHVLSVTSSWYQKKLVPVCMTDLPVSGTSRLVPETGQSVMPIRRGDVMLM